MGIIVLQDEWRLKPNLRHILRTAFLVTTLFFPAMMSTMMTMPLLTTRLMNSSTEALRPGAATLAYSPAQSALQVAVDAAMGSRPGTAILADVHTGRVLAAHNFALAAQRLAHPGSAIKPFVLLALLRSGKLSPNEHWTCPRHLTLGNQRLDCTHPISTEPFDAAAALANSCNNYFVHMGSRLRAHELLSELRRSGLASPSGFISPSGLSSAQEATGTLRLPTTPLQLQLQSIGEYGVEVTPLGLLAAYQRLAIEIAAAPTETDRHRDRVNATMPLQVTLQGLEDSVAHGMARNAAVTDLQVAGKTGTAASGEYHRTRGWFVGFAPAVPRAISHQQIALVVYLEQSRGADAAAIANQIFRAWYGATAARSPIPPRSASR